MARKQLLAEMLTEDDRQLGEVEGADRASRANVKPLRVTVNVKLSATVVSKLHRKPTHCIARCFE